MFCFFESTYGSHMMLDPWTLVKPLRVMNVLLTSETASLRRVERVNNLDGLFFLSFFFVTPVVSRMYSVFSSLTRRPFPR